MIDVIVREASASDVEALTAIHGEGRRWAYRGLLPDAVFEGGDAERRARWERVLALPSAQCATFLALRNGAPVGFVSVGSSRDADGQAVGEIYAIYLRASSVAGLGVGRALMERALETLAREGFDVATLWVLTSNERARRFYERAGFAPDGAAKVEVERGVELPHVRYRFAMR